SVFTADGCVSRQLLPGFIDRVNKNPDLHRSRVFEDGCRWVGVLAYFEETEVSFRTIPGSLSWRPRS
ncbi:hypothetical protein NDU88_001957, partial [Pleurodeles waltl]